MASAITLEMSDFLDNFTNNKDDRDNMFLMCITYGLIEAPEEEGGSEKITIEYKYEDDKSKHYCTMYWRPNEKYKWIKNRYGVSSLFAIWWSQVIENDEE